MAQGWLMSTLTNKAILLGMVNFAAGIPTLALTMLGGSVADKYDKRKILIWTQFAQTALALILGILVYTGRIHVWHVVVVAAFLGICIAFEMPAINALVPELVKRDEIATAIALDRSVFHGSRLVGPSLAGIFVAWWGAASAFFANAGSFFALVIALISLPPRTLGTAEEEEQRRSGFKEGLRYVRNDRTILCMIGLIALTTIFVFPFLSVMLPLDVRNILKLGPERLGLLMAVSGTGALFGALGLLSVARDHRFRFMTSAVVLVALALLRAYIYQIELRGVFEAALAVGETNDQFDLAQSGIKVEYDVTRPPVLSFADLMDDSKGRVMRMSLDTNHSDGFDQFDTVIDDRMRRDGGQPGALRGGRVELHRRLREGRGREPQVRDGQHHHHPAGAHDAAGRLADQAVEAFLGYIHAAPAGRCRRSTT